MDLGLNLKIHCHVNENGDGDRFVGIKTDTSRAVVYFPMGYGLPESESDIRQDIIRLIDVLSLFNGSKDKVLATSNLEAPYSVNFPINAYMNIIRHFLEQDSYYTEKDPIRKTSDRGKIDWTVSLKRNIAFFQEDGMPFFDRYTVKGLTSNENNLITQIHKYCVFVAFSTLGWLFTPHIPPDPHIDLDKERFLFALRKKLAVTHNDKDKKLFQDMLSMIEHLDNENTEKQYYFGTNHFEYVWEKLIDEVFGMKGKEEFFPRTKWSLKFGDDKNNHALEPDTVMICQGKIYVLDAKYYRYGVTGQTRHLPESTSINKQITYGEYIDNCQDLKDKYGELPIYNAFLMPYNKDKNPFDLHNEYFANIGEAISEWKSGCHLYERVQGIVVDIRYLMNNYYGSHKSKINKMAETIEKALTENDDQLSQTE